MVARGYAGTMCELELDNWRRVMSVNMSGFDKNPFKVGDKVRVKASVLSTFPVVFKNFLSVKYAIVTGIESYRVFTNVDDEHTHFEHFEIYKEEKDMTQQTQQKTKRVPFSKEVWLKHKNAKVIWTPTEAEILYFDKWGGCDYDFIGVYKAPGAEYAASTFVEGDFPNMALEIPITTKRIPFNPELKDVKVFIERGNCPVKEWYVFSNGVVAVLPETSSYLTAKDQSELEMEIEE
jgi:hypothetical protein